MRKTFYAALAVFVMGVSALAESVPLKVGLTDACRLALENNPAMKAAREQLVLQDGVLKEARAVSMPRISANGNYSTFDDERLQSFGEGVSPDSTRWNASLDAEMTVFSGGRNVQYIKGQQAVKRSIGSGVEAYEAELLTRIHSIYYDAWLSDQTAAAQQEAISVLERQLEIAKDMFEAGSGEKYDVTQAEVALANARPPFIRAQNDRRRSIDSLQEIIGLPYPEGVDSSGIQLDELKQREPVDVQLEDAISEALANRPEMAQVKHDMEAAERESSLFRREFSPRVDLYAGYGIESDMFGLGDELEGWSSGVKVSWDLVDGGARLGKIQQANARQRQAEHRSRETRLRIEGEVRKAWYDRQEAAAIYEASAKVIEQALEALEMAQARYKTGNGTQLDVLESQLQLTRARLEHSTARRDLELSYVRMKQAVGQSIIPID